MAAPVRLIADRTVRRQLLTLAVGVLVAALAVIAAEHEREQAQHHFQIASLLQQARAAGLELSAVNPVPSKRTETAAQARKELGDVLDQLDELTSDDDVAVLRADAARWAGHPGNVRAMQRAALKLDADARTAADRQQRVARSSEKRSDYAFVASLVLALIALAILLSRFGRLRARVQLAEQRDTLERRSERRVRALVDRSSDVVSVLDADLAIRWQAASIARILGHDPGPLLGAPLESIVVEEDRPLVAFHLRECLINGRERTFEARFTHARGGWRHVEAIAESRLDDPAIDGLVISMRDISERKALESELRVQAYRDGLTGLANRALFEQRLAAAISAAGRSEHSLAVLFFDLDDFKLVNDELGHARGDALLRAVGTRIRDALRPEDTPARVGGDEFAVIIDQVDDVEAAEQVAERMLAALHRPFELDGRELTVSASVGIALGDGSARGEELLRNADFAMYAAKAQEKGSIRYYEEAMHLRALERVRLTSDIAGALEAGEFELDYQPIVNLASGRVVGLEALVRWRHGARGRLPPSEFIELAEGSGDIVELGLWILESACAQLRDWQQAGHPRLALTVNVSPRQLCAPEFAAHVTRVLAWAELEPQSLVLEVTESFFLEDHAPMLITLNALRAGGVRIAIDDFGTGQSMLARLKDLPVDILKLDQSFVVGIEHDPAQAALLRGIIHLGHLMELNVVAEGIETDAQLELVRGMQAAYGQGYFLSRPLPRADVLAVLSAPVLAAKARTP